MTNPEIGEHAEPIIRSHLRKCQDALEAVGMGTGVAQCLMAMICFDEVMSWGRDEVHKDEAARERIKAQQIAFFIMVVDAVSQTATPRVTDEVRNVVFAAKRGTVDG